MESANISWPDERLNRKEAAAYIGLDNPNTLAVWASTGRYGLPFIKIGRKVFYRRSDLDAFLEKQTVRPRA